MTSNELRSKFLEFFQERGHKVIPSSSLVPENDPSVLFTTAGMHPLVPYLTGQKHPAGQRLTNIQRCIRTGDIDEVGDTYHHTFFEMLGNWSIGDLNASDGIGDNGYWKKQAIEWSFDFLTSKKYLNIPIEKLAVSVFEGDEDAPFDEESFDLWSELGIAEKRIVKLPKKNNWWGQVLGPCGPNTEMFFWSGDEQPPKSFDHEDATWIEIWNDVFMEFDRKVKKVDEDGHPVDFYFDRLKQKNVDTGMGLERTLALLNGLDDNYRTELFWPIIQQIEELSGKKYKDFPKEMRIVADHLKAATMIIHDGIVPSNVNRGYVLRRLIRRAVRKSRSLKRELDFLPIIETICRIYNIEINEHIRKIILEEVKKFEKPLNWVDQYKSDLDQAINQGLMKKIKDIPILLAHDVASGEYVYENYQTYGVPADLSIEVVKELGLKFDQDGFDTATQKHQELSRTASAGMFKGGLADNKVETTRLHTAAHLLLAALRQVLSTEVNQKGSNITEERLRFDFNWPEKLTPKQISEVETIVNEKIKEDIPVEMEELTLDAAKSSGASGVFDDRYGEKVKVYTIGKFSKEICGGPHVEKTGELGSFKITKEESSSAGIRRIKAILE